MIHTSKQQQALEEKSRLAWLNSIVESGMYLAEAASHIGVKSSVLHGMLQRRGLKLTINMGRCGPHPDMAKDAKCIALVNDGMSAKEIAAEMGVTCSVTYRRLNRLGIKAQSDGRSSRPRKTPNASKATLSPESISIVQHLIAKTKLTPQEIAVAAKIPVARVHQLSRATL